MKPAPIRSVFENVFFRAVAVGVRCQSSLERMALSAEPMADAVRTGARAHDATRCFEAGTASQRRGGPEGVLSCGVPARIVHKPDDGVKVVMDIRFVEPGSALHREELELRYRVLRAPLEMARGSEVYTHEKDCLHLVAVDTAEGVVGCVVFHPGGDGRGAGTGRLLQMAVAPQGQGRGLGRRLVETLEAHLAHSGYHEVTLHAREVATGFYGRLGYEFFGEPYLEVGVTHRNMRKDLTPKDG